MDATPTPPMRETGRKCADCGAALNEQTQKREPLFLAYLCDACDARDRDDLAWLTGTGRFSQ